MRYLILALCLSIAGCVIHRLDVKPVDVTSAAPVTVTTPVKVHLHDGSTVVFAEGVRVADNMITGKGRRYDLTLDNSTAVTQIPLGDVAAMESYQTPINTPATAAASVGSGVGITLAAITAALLLFGSCPTVYSYDGNHAMLEAEMFSYSIAPSFQSRDIDRLGISAVDDGVFVLELRNEMLETHYIDQLQVLEVVHEPNEHVYPDHKGRPLRVGELIAPVAAVDQTGRDIVDSIAQADDRAWQADDARLQRISADDYIDHLDLEFDVPADGEDLALVFKMRNSLLNTVLFYDVMLKEQGFGALDWLGSDLNRLGNKIDLGLWYRKHMGLTVSVWERGRYRKVAKIGDQGPIAWSERAVRLPSANRDGPLKVRLTFVADNWRFDQVALAANATRAKSRTVSAAAVNDASGERPDVPQFIERADKTYLITQPQDSLKLSFDVGPPVANKERTFFLVSDGYYIEWMRGEWLSEERTGRFVPNDDALLRALTLWRDVREDYREQFDSTRLMVR